MNWLRTAQDVTGCGGVSGGYSLIDGWLASYPETTGYIIPTFLDYADFSGETEWKERAFAMAVWEIDVQMPNGAVQAGLYDGRKQVEAVFNTGQVILGWCRAFDTFRELRFLESAKRAADWLISVQSDDGSWTIASEETETSVHTYDVRTAWSLLEFASVSKDDRYAGAARRNFEWALDQQTANGWFRNNAFFETEGKWSVPFTHTIAYVMEGFQEATRILGDERYKRAYEITSERLMRYYELKRYLPGDFDENWKSSGRYSCLTGSAQIAAVWLRHFERFGDARYLNAGLKLNDFVKSCQDLSNRHRGIRGAVKGSQPITGRYTPFIYPNWAAKFLADSLMIEECLMATIEDRILQGGHI